jgi:integrase
LTRSAAPGSTLVFATTTSYVMGAGLRTTAEIEQYFCRERVTAHPIPRPAALLRNVVAPSNHPTKIVQKRLGHSTIRATMDIYSHVLPGTQETTGKLASRLVRKEASGQ